MSTPATVWLPPLFMPETLSTPARAAVQRELEDADDRRAAFLREGDAVVAEVVEVAVRGRDDVELSVVEPLRKLRVVPDARIDRDRAPLGDSIRNAAWPSHVTFPPKTPRHLRPPSTRSGRELLPRDRRQ